MEKAGAIAVLDLGGWRVSRLICLLPAWLVTVAVMAEGFPRPWVTREAALVSLAAAVLLSGWLLVSRRASLMLVAYSFTPLFLAWLFDEISTRYKTPYLVLSALVLSVGILASFQARRAMWRWFILGIAVALALGLAWNGTLHFWHMAADLGYVRCFPDAYGCAPLDGEAVSPWRLFFWY